MSYKLLVEPDWSASFSDERLTRTDGRFYVVPQALKGWRPMGCTGLYSPYD